MWETRELYLKHFPSAMDWCRRSSATAFLQRKDKHCYPPPEPLTREIAWVYPADGAQPHGIKPPSAAPSAAVTIWIYPVPQCKHAPLHGQRAISLLISCKILYDQQLGVHCLCSRSASFLCQTPAWGIGTFFLYLLPPRLLHLLSG